MNDTNCGCNAHNPSDKEFLLVKATSSEASSCGTGDGLDPISDCVKQEQMYDFSLSDFMVPSQTGATSMEVCNPNVYSIGMWLQFTSPIVTLQISNISGSILTLINHCPDGSIVGDNPDVGQVVYRNTRFVVSSAPGCISDEKYLEKIQDALSSVVEICVPNLAQSSSTAIIQPVGRVDSDPNNLGAKKCIRRIFGFLFKAGTPVLSALKLVKGEQAYDYRRIVKHKITNEIKHLENYGEYAELLIGRQYLVGIQKNSETLIGPSYVMYPFHSIVHENTASLDPNDWPDLNLTYDHDFDIGGVPQIEGLDGSLDHYFANVRIEVAVRSVADNITKIYLNNVSSGRVYSSQSSTESNIQFNSITIPIRVSRSDNKINLKITARETSKFYFKLSLSGAMR